MDIVEATHSYESWAGSQVKLFRKDVKYKHRQMEKAQFPFLRATFYRWVQLWREACPELLDAPGLLAVGDLHVENFGTWRDADGRLVWGINDFDEAAHMPYALDLVRLATSALLAVKEHSLTITEDRACAAILHGYVQVLRDGPKSFVLEEDHPALRAMALGADRDPRRFWKKMRKQKARMPVPADIRKLLAVFLPTPQLPFKVVHRRAGLGSLGRPRHTALALWHEAMIAREAKALLPSAYGWAVGRSGRESLCRKLMERAVRSPDPSMIVHGDWIVRRLAPHCSRIELSAFPKRRAEREILEAMGRETANAHFATPEAIPAVRKDLRSRVPGWLIAAARTMAAATHDDWRRWKAR